MANENVIQATFDGFYKTYTKPSWLIDHGMELSISGIDLPDEFECHFSNSRSVAAKRQIGENGVVTIPDEYFLSNAAQIFCWIYLHPTVDSGVTEYEIVIPLLNRPNVDPAEPTQEQQDIVDQAIAALNVAMAETSADAESASASATAAQAAVDSVLNMTVSADTLPSGSDASVTKSVVDDAVHLAFGIPQGAQGVQGEQGVQGPTGATPNFTIGTVQTLLPTQDATATITGTAEAPVLNLGIPKGYSGDATNLAADYSSNKIYAVGEYCIYNGSLYRCITAITTAETWTAAHWTAAVLGDDVGDLKSAMEDAQEDIEDMKDVVLTPDYSDATNSLTTVGNGYYNNPAVQGLTDWKSSSETITYSYAISAGNAVRVKGYNYYSCRLVYFRGTNAHTDDVVYPGTTSGSSYYEKEFVAKYDGTLYIGTAANKTSKLKVEVATTYKPNTLTIDELYGKTWLCMGDSITYNSPSYREIIAEKTGVVPTNAGRTGTGYTTGSGGYSNFATRIASITDVYDIFTIFGSTNDQAYAQNDTLIGSKFDTGSDTYCGFVNQAIDAVYATGNYHLGIISPIPWNSNGGNPTYNLSGRKMAQALKDICEYRGIPFLDLFRSSNMQPWDADFRTAYIPDGTHPNEAGYKIFANRIEAFIRSL